jgi:hypothetical protein
MTAYGLVETCSCVRKATGVDLAVNASKLTCEVDDIVKKTILTISQAGACTD